MSTPEKMADTRHEYESHELPPQLGKNPTEQALKSWYSDYGYIWLCQITNNSNNTVKFYNPYYDTSGDIAPGKTESYNSKGYLPLWSHSRKYEITHTAFGESRKMTIKDLDGNWWLSFEHDGVDEDIRAVRPPCIVFVSGINLTITETGYEIYSVGWSCVNSRFSFQK